MNTITCPHCGHEINLDAQAYDNVAAQVRTAEFEREVQRRADEMEKTYRVRLDAEIAQACQEVTLEQTKAEQLKTDYEQKLREQQLASDLAMQRETANLRESVMNERNAVQALQLQMDAQKTKYELEAASMQQSYEAQLRLKDEEVAQYRDFKLRQSTKMIGESLEQHCEQEFNKVRAMGFERAYFEKDNTVSRTSGSKGDFIFRDFDEFGNEYVSIMFEMKNEMDATATKHKNRDFFKELDKDRREKKCEYAVLVTMLEADNEYYNTGIVDVCHEYPKMYVVRPQFFIPILSLIRNMARNLIEKNIELARIQQQRMDVVQFENALAEFKDKFGRNCQLAGDRFQEALSSIDKAIDMLQRTKDMLQVSMKHLSTANNQADGLTIKSLTVNNPGMRDRFLLEGNRNIG